MIVLSLRVTPAPRRRPVSSVTTNLLNLHPRSLQIPKIALKDQRAGIRHPSV